MLRDSMTYQLDEKAIRREVSRRVRRTIFFLLHLMFTCMLMAALSSARVYNSPVGWFLGLWVFTFPVHCLWLVYQWMVDRGVQRELARQSQLLILTEKRKNDFSSPSSPARLRLADDGELIDPFLDVDADLEK